MARLPRVVPLRTRGVLQQPTALVGRCLLPLVLLRCTCCAAPVRTELLLWDRTYGCATRHHTAVRAEWCCCRWRETMPTAPPAVACASAPEAPALPPARQAMAALVLSRRRPLPPRSACANAAAESCIAAANSAFANPTKQPCFFRTPNQPGKLCPIHQFTQARGGALRVACCVCVLRVACCVLRVACCVLRVACCVCCRAGVEPGLHGDAVLSTRAMLLGCAGRVRPGSWHSEPCRLSAAVAATLLQPLSGALLPCPPPPHTHKTTRAVVLPAECKKAVAVLDLHSSGK
jgi:hypothetical protein